MKILAILVGLAILLCLTTPSTSAQGASQCVHAPNCVELPGQQTGTYTAANTVIQFTIKAGQNRFDFDPSQGLTFDDGCYRGSFSTSEGGQPNNTVAWERYGEPGPGCQEISHLEVWYYQAPTAVTLKTFTTTDSYSPPYWLLGVAIVLLIIGIALRRRWIKKGWLK